MRQRLEEADKVERLARRELGQRGAQLVGVGQKRRAHRLVAGIVYRQHRRDAGQLEQPEQRVEAGGAGHVAHHHAHRQRLVAQPGQHVELGAQRPAQLGQLLLRLPVQRLGRQADDHDRLAAAHRRGQRPAQTGGDKLARRAHRLLGEIDQEDIAAQQAAQLSVDQRGAGAELDPPLRDAAEALDELGLAGRLGPEQHHRVELVEAAPRRGRQPAPESPPVAAQLLVEIRPALRRRRLGRRARGLAAPRPPPHQRGDDDEQQQGQAEQDPAGRRHPVESGHGRVHQIGGLQIGGLQIGGLQIGGLQAGGLHGTSQRHL